MRLDDFDPDINVGDQRGRGGGFGGGGLLLGLLPLIFSRFGLGGVIVVVAVLFFLGGNPLGLVGGDQAPSGQVGYSEGGAGTDATRACTVDAASKAACDAFSSANETWRAIFRDAGAAFREPSLQFYGGSGRSGCGAAQAAMGPFYCPADQGIYLDTGFFDELAERYGARGDFAQDYVIAHEFGHHVQNLLGTSAQVARAQAGLGDTAGNRLSVMLELQADCYAGIWAAHNRNRLEPGDIEEGMTAANAIGDDTLQREARGRVMPDSFTHGTSQQRMHWLRVGLESGDPAACNTFEALS
ncbi:KPN_02809 family neutral zinc metallopeptidase [Stakelama saccharophila]|uniref:Neutral zinc metallopeptidase n=1 Tax=Stakelama saccharophila TaxID=3075605 RepID=A0ABZ0BAJ9_9SPHN|nr:neutral zinc metallopeptidase [Stakelama sp. W311]WNO54404.1 neutral zinc metallopeptidase [Stakelama sp. W311]